jgi:hypothetical protein
VRTDPPLDTYRADAELAVTGEEFTDVVVARGSRPSPPRRGLYIAAEFLSGGFTKKPIAAPS